MIPSSAKLPIRFPGPVRLPVSIALVLAFAAASAPAQEETRHESPTGTYILVLRPRKEGGCTFELGRRADGDDPYVTLGRGALPRYDKALVLDEEPGAVLIDEMTGGAEGDAAARLDPSGERRWRVSVQALFPGAPFPMDLGRLHWRRAAWVDEERGHVVVVAKGGLLRRIDLATGAAIEAEAEAAAGADIVLRGLTLPGARAEAVEAVADLHEALGTRAVGPLAALVASPGVKAPLRRRAAEMLALLPAEAVVEDIFKRMKDADPATTGALLDAAVATGAPDLMTLLRHREPELLKALEKRTGPLDWLADYFRTHPTSEAVRPLQAALAKNPRHPTLAPKLIGALKTCTGIDLGDDTDAWLRYRHPG